MATFIGIARDSAVGMAPWIITQALRIAKYPPILSFPDKITAKLEITRAWAMNMEYTTAAVADMKRVKLGFSKTANPLRELKARKRKEKAVALAERMMRELQTKVARSGL